MNELVRLRDLLESGQVKLGIHIRSMNAPGSPVFRLYENLWMPAGILVASFLALRFVHVWAGMIVLAAGCWYWFYKVLPRISTGVFDRSAALALSSERTFDDLWAKGVLSLYAELPDGTKRAATRKDDWRQFVRDIG
jgi:hypothetical protein